MGKAACYSSQSLCPGLAPSNWTHRDLGFSFQTLQGSTSPCPDIWSYLVCPPKEKMRNVKYQTDVLWWKDLQRLTNAGWTPFLLLQLPNNVGWAHHSICGLGLELDGPWGTLSTQAILWVYDLLKKSYFDKNLAKVLTTNVLAKSCDGNMFITVAIIVMTPLYSLPDCCTPTQIPTITLDLWSYFLFFLEAFQAVHCMIKSSSERLLHIFYWSL